MPLLRNLLAGDSLAARAVRFAMVGGTSGAAYALFTWVLVRKAALSPALASACAYALVIPINFALQKLFTFRSANPLREETPRYLAVHGANILCAYLAMAATQNTSTPSSTLPPVSTSTLSLLKKIPEPITMPTIIATAVIRP